MKPWFKPAAGVLATLVLAVSAALPALADGAVTFKNSTVDKPVTVEIRMGNTQDDAIPAGAQKLAKNESVSVGPTNLQVFWRREDPAAGDGKWTAWQKVDARNGDQKVEF